MPAIVAGLAVGAVAAGAVLSLVWLTINRFVDQRIYSIVIDYKHDSQYRTDLTRKPITMFGTYAGLEVIGAGGMGYVCRASDSEHRNEFAVKILADELSEDEQARRTPGRLYWCAQGISDGTNNPGY